MDAINTLFGTMLTQMATKQKPDTAALLNVMPEGNPATDMMKKMFGVLDAMQNKLSGSR
jgi:hypothetical protein